MVPPLLYIIHIHINLGMDQLINEPTHKFGNFLDLLLTDDPRLISNVNVNGSWNLCKSEEHFRVIYATFQP